MGGGVGGEVSGGMGGAAHGLVHALEGVASDEWTMWLFVAAVIERKWVVFVSVAEDWHAGRPARACEHDHEADPGSCKGKQQPQHGSHIKEEL